MNNTVIAIDKSGSLRIYLTVSTEPVAAAVGIHETFPTASVALGRAVTAAGLMGIMMQKDDSRLTLQVKGDGPAAEILACADAQGCVKAYIANPYIDLPLRGDGHYDVGRAVGKGTLTVIKDLGLKEPYVGRTELVSGEIAEDIAHYLAGSEQTPSSVSLGVKLSGDGSIACAAGLIIQVLPGASDKAIEAFEDILFFMDSLTLLAQDAGGDPKTLLGLIFKNVSEEFKPEILEERNILWHCGCSRERMEQALASIGKKELEDIIREDGKAEISCSFCRSRYNFGREELESLLCKM